MARVNDMIESKYLKQSDVPEDVIVTVAKIGKVNIAKEGDPAEEKWACKFREFQKPMLLNSTNIKLLEKACGSDDTDDWIGKEVILYVDENVSFGGQVVGGLRIRKQRQEPAKKTPPAAAAAQPAGAPKAAGKTGFDDMDDDIPF